MTEDQVLIDRIRPILADRQGSSEKKMFGGVCFLINGNMCAGTWKGSLIVRLGKENREETLKRPHTKPANITGRVMKGWAMVEPAGLESDRGLKEWVESAAEYAASLPAK